MRVRHDRVRVTVPATCANLGPGFDSFGVAVALYDQIEVAATAGDIRVEVIGEGADQVPADDSHLVVRAIHAGLDAVGAPLTGLHLRCRNRIPHGRGLGSSAAAVVAGLHASRLLVGEEDGLSDNALLELATRFEGHIDNAAPALLGGFTVAYEAEPGPTAVRVAVHDSIVPILAVPESSLSTRAARSVLPPMVTRAEASFNLARSALFVEAVSRSPQLLFDATADALHQESRRSVMEASMQLVDELRAKKIAAAVSGAGPTVCVLGTDETVVQTVATLAGPGWRTGALPISSEGVRGVVDTDAQ